jgi:hypothetical protein
MTLHTFAVLVTILFVIAVIMAFRYHVIKEFQYKIDLLKDYKNTFRLTPIWTYYDNVSSFKIFLRLTFGDLKMKSFKRSPYINGIQDFLGLVIYKKDKKTRMINLVDIVYNKKYLAKDITISLGLAMTDLFQKNIGYNITTIASTEEGRHLFLESVHFVKNTRANLLPCDIFNQKSGIPMIAYKD